MQNAQSTKQLLEVLKETFQDAYRNSSHQETFHDWIQEYTWGVHLRKEEMTRWGVDDAQAEQRVQQKEQNNQTVRELFFQSIAQKAPFSVDFMCDVHGALFNRVFYGCGFFRTENVHMYNTQIKSPSPWDIFSRVRDMQATYDQSEKGLLDMFNLHYDIIVTQPFSDGNKSIARTMLNYELMKHGYPPVLFSSVKDKELFITAVEQGYTDNDKTSFYEFMTDKMYSTALQSIRLLSGEPPQPAQECAPKIKVVATHSANSADTGNCMSR